MLTKYFFKKTKTLKVPHEKENTAKEFFVIFT